VWFLRRRVTAETEEVERRERRSLPAWPRSSGTSRRSGALLATAKLERALPGLGIGAGTAIGRVRCCGVVPRGLLAPRVRPSGTPPSGMDWPGCEV
jgi:hypothetical protein